MPQVFRTLIPLLLAFALGAASQPATPDAARLSDADRHDLRCAAAFAVVAVLQTRGDAAALALPPLGIRGKTYLGQVGERIATATGLSGEAVRALLVTAAKAATRDGAVAVARPCLAALDAAVPPRPVPDAVTCQALLGVYAEVLAARTGDSAIGRTLAHESALLSAAAHRQMAARGLDPAAEAAAIEQQRTRIRAALDDGSDTIDADDFVLCRRLATARPG